MKKRLLPMFLALALCVGLCAPKAFADRLIASEEDITSTFTIMRNGTIDELEGRYRCEQPILVDDDGSGEPAEIYYEVFDRNDSWTITNTGSKAISDAGSTDYTIRFVTWQYAYSPEWGYGWVGGTSTIDAEGRQVHAPDEGTQLAILKAGESITIHASAFEGEYEGYIPPYDGTGIVHALSIDISYGTQADSGYVEYTFFFRADAAKKAAIDNAQDGKPVFNDVPGWCAPAVDWAVGRGITKGYGNNDFRPDTPCTHAQILTFLWRACGEQPPMEGPHITTEPYYQEAVDWAFEQGMLWPSFDPDEPCSRADAVNYIWLCFDTSADEGSPGGFVDVPEGAPFEWSINWAVGAGITNGYANGDGTFSFRPGQVCSRGEIVTLLHRAYVPNVRLK